MPKMTTEDFVTQAKAIHRGKYDYSKVVYKGSREKVCIICPKHGEFWQTPYLHLKGHGCQRCANEANVAKIRLWTKDKCREAALQYSDMSSFRIQSKSAYTAAVKHGWLKDFTWLKHKINLVKPKKKRHYYNQQEIIERLLSLFGDRYSYDKVVYRGMKVPITLICHEKDENGIEHGEFKMRPDNIFSGKQSCPKCWQARRGIIQRKSVEEFIKESRKVHGNKYNYRKVNYINTKTKVCIICPIHGEFWQTPSNHIKGKGCSLCAGNAKKWNQVSCKQEAKKYNSSFGSKIS